MTATDWQAVLVELLNTTPVIDGVASDEFDDDDAARSWLRGRGGDGSEDLDDVRRVREDLQRVVRGELAPTVLDGHLDGVRQVPHVGADGLTWSFEGAVDWPARAVLAWGAVHTDAPGRLRPCANDECRLFLLDRTRAGTARWCSMSTCGNRMKARRHYDRQFGRSG